MEPKQPQCNSGARYWLCFFLGPCRCTEFLFWSGSSCRQQNIAKDTLSQSRTARPTFAKAAGPQRSGQQSLCPRAGPGVPYRAVIHSELYALYALRIGSSCTGSRDCLEKIECARRRLRRIAFLPCGWCVLVQSRPAKQRWDDHPHLGRAESAGCFRHRAVSESICLSFHSIANTIGKGMVRIEAPFSSLDVNMLLMGTKACKEGIVGTAVASVPFA